MSQAQKESLHQIFRDLHAHRVKTMDPATLQINIDQRRTLVDTADRSRFVVGDTVQPFTLEEVDGESITLDSLVERGPGVLVFFRFEGCPACNLALPFYQRNLLPGLRELSACRWSRSAPGPGEARRDQAPSLARVRGRFGSRQRARAEVRNSLHVRRGIAPIRHCQQETHRGGDRDGHVGAPDADGGRHRQREGRSLRGRAPRLAGADRSRRDLGGGGRRRRSFEGASTTSHFAQRVIVA